MATPEATSNLEGPGYTRHVDVTISNLGIGTYLGEPDDENDDRYRRAVDKALGLGCNVIDTAVNYRNQRSERVIGDVLSEYRRDEVFLSTKGGFIPFDGDVPDSPENYLIRNYVDPGIVAPEEVVETNCLTPKFIENQLETSLDNLGTDYIDLYYVHNPEIQLAEFDEGEVENKLREVFELLEQKITEGDIREYGVASWKAFRVPESHDRHMSLEQICRIAEGASDGDSGLEAVQLPYNAHMNQAYTEETQRVYGEKLSAFDAAEKLDIDVFVSASLMQGRLSKITPEALDDIEGSNVEAALNFARSPPQVAAALFGSRDVGHVEENLEVLNKDKVEGKEYQKLFE
ncbi:MAG: aldo/keto reductase [Halobacteria archaeon]